MLSGPAILRISVLMLVAGALAALVQFLLPGAPSGPVVEPPVATRPAEPPAPPTPVPSTPVPSTPVPSTPAPAPREPAPVQAAPAPQRPDAPAGPAQMPADALAFPTDPAPGSQAPTGEAEVTRAEDSAGPRALAILDLNTASVADLNRLRGGGAIGRAIVAKRPYTSVDQLLSKRVLSRAVYDRIKEQVTVR